MGFLDRDDQTRSDDLSLESHGDTLLTDPDGPFRKLIGNDRQSFLLGFVVPGVHKGDGKARADGDASSASGTVTGKGGGGHDALGVNGERLELAALGAGIARDLLDTPDDREDGVGTLVRLREVMTCTWLPPEYLHHLLPFRRGNGIEAHVLKDLPAHDPAAENGCRGLGNDVRITRSIDLHPELPGLPIDLVHRGQAHGNEQCVHLEDPLGTGYRSEALVDLRDDHPFQLSVTLCPEHGMRGPHGYSQPFDLIKMDLVPTALRECLHDPEDIDACLEGMIGSNETHIPTPNHEESVRGTDEVPVHKGLEGAGTIHTWEITPREGKGLFPCPSGHQEPLCLHQHELSVFYNSDPLICKHSYHW